MSTTYVSNSVPYGAIVVSLKRLVATIGTYVLESITIERGSNLVERGNEVNSDNGWAISPPKGTPGSCVIQIPLIPTTSLGSKTPLPGDYFDFTFDFTIGQERFVIISVSAPLAQGDYVKVNATLRKDSFPT